jgi:hypothetical protein
MSKRKFSIFKVYDYKGGELNSNINLDERTFYAELAQLFEDQEFLEDDLADMTEEEICIELKRIEASNDFYSYYAGSDGGFCGEIYEHINGNLVEVKIEDFIPQIAYYIKEEC